MNKPNTLYESILLDLDIASKSTSIPSEQDFLYWVKTALQGHKQPSTEISIRIVDRDESQSLNHQYRGKNKPTNVLSFAADFPEGTDISFMGDLVICAPVVEQEAEEQNKTLSAHWAHMVIHGCLHLLGYDHVEEHEAEQMEKQESLYLAQLGFPCPYDD